MGASIDKIYYAQSLEGLNLGEDKVLIEGTIQTVFGSAIEAGIDPLTREILRYDAEGLLSAIKEKVLGNGQVNPDSLRVYSNLLDLAKAEAAAVGMPEDDPRVAAVNDAKALLAEPLNPLRHEI